jgi:hypothetical protein
MESEGYGLEVYTTAAVMGQIMLKTGAVWAAITAVPLSTDTIGIVLDATKEDPTKKRILVKGEAVVGANALTYFGGATNPNKLAVNALLEARDIQVNAQI